MKLGEIRMVDHPRGRDAMTGWVLTTVEGVGFIKGFQLVEKQGDDEGPRWMAVIEVMSPPSKLGKNYLMDPGTEIWIQEIVPKNGKDETPDSG